MVIHWHQTCCQVIAGMLALVSATATRAALLDGKVMSVDLTHQTSENDQLTGVFARNFVVGPEVELPGFGLRDNPPLPALVDIDISDETILLTLLIDQPFATTEVIRFLDSNDTIPGFTDVLIDPSTNWAGMSPFRVFADISVINLNLSRLSGLAGQHILLHVIVPEPAAIVLLAVGVGAFAVRRRVRPASRHGNLAGAAAQPH